jgi:adenylate cyclase
MGKEIERKFLIDAGQLELKNGQRIIQGYLPTSNLTVVRVRLLEDKALLTVKGKNSGAVRSEFEYEIPTEDAKEMLSELCDVSKIDKTRYVLKHGGKLWEVDIFHGQNEGLIVAEVELESEHDEIEMPDWVVAEVTGDPKYYNSSLLSDPFQSWE